MEGLRAVAQRGGCFTDDSPRVSGNLPSITSGALRNRLILAA